MLFTGGGARTPLTANHHFLLHPHVPHSLTGDIFLSPQTLVIDKPEASIRTPLHTTPCGLLDPGVPPLSHPHRLLFSPISAPGIPDTLFPMTPKIKFHFSYHLAYASASPKSLLPIRIDLPSSSVMTPAFQDAAGGFLDFARGSSDFPPRKCAPSHFTFRAIHHHTWSPISSIPPTICICTFFLSPLQQESFGSANTSSTHPSLEREFFVPHSFYYLRGSPF